MFLTEIRGGIPRIRQHTVDTTGAGYRPPNCPTKYIQINNDDEAESVRVYFEQSDFDDDINYITLGPSGTGTEFFEGPVELSDEQDMVWLRAVGGTPVVTVVSYFRRG